MLSKVLNSAILVTILSAGLGHAQSLAQLGGPANLPPSGFSGQQFVDNRGCLFLKAGFGTTVNWVPRVDRRHKPLCGLPPTFGAAVIAAVDQNMAPDPEARPVTVPAAPVVAAQATPPQQVAPTAAASPVVAAATPPAPQPQVAAAPPAPRKSLMEVLFGNPQPARVARPAAMAAAAPVVAPAAPPQPRYVAADLAGPASGQIGCWSSAPRLERVLLRTGSTALVCTRGDGTLTGWRPPNFPRNAGTGAALNAPHLTAAMMEGATVVGTSRVAAAAASNAVPTPPPGYQMAWKDDRLNPMRGIGTASGQAQQDQVWTRDIPAVLVTTAPQATAVAAPRARVTVSTMSAPQTRAQAAPAQNAAQPAAQRGAAYVQVGTFGQVANADSVKARLRALGLPVSTSKITRKGKVLQVIYAGPFATATQAQTALGLARGAGFGDAILK